jgi:IS5 family transposase
VIADSNGIIDSVVVKPANVHDSRIFREEVNKTYQPEKQILLDSAYVGEQVRLHCQNHNLRSVVVPKRKRNGEMSHVLSLPDSDLIKTRWVRYEIERVIGMMRRFKGDHSYFYSKFNKSLEIYAFYVRTVALIIVCYNVCRS